MGTPGIDSGDVDIDRKTYLIINVLPHPAGFPCDGRIRRQDEHGRPGTGNTTAQCTHFSDSSFYFIKSRDKNGPRWLGDDIVERTAYQTHILLKEACHQTGNVPRLDDGIFKGYIFLQHTARIGGVQLKMGMKKREIGRASCR